MKNDPRSWHELQQECQRDLAAVDEHAAAVRGRVLAMQGRLDLVEAQILEQRQRYGHWAVRWLWNWQLKKLERQRRECARMLAELDETDQERDELRAKVEEPLIVRPRWGSVVRVPIEAILFLMLVTMLACVASQWLVHR